MYVWSDTDKLFSGVRIIFTDTEKSNWTWDEEAKAYYWHRFFSHQPDLNFDNPRVLEEVLRAMRFWLDMGVDGLRLDAIPYLVERDGTSCENLAETHAVIRQIRAAIDSEYENRLILAEANMWPTDVRPYFGDSDECHMAFHFPLMPRIYMALRQEDRLPVTEIMARTPEIPDGCQWGLFLRNHDELTLEMVTNEERDYMYFAYSADPRMRINVGIRRRLAPLVDNNRRRIELLNSILFSFPGTPILYYGDEIGMGDNIYLGDRNGVRTPMQWNSDRNAGFSRAVPAKLYSPVIMDPIWGYQAINVEAQEGDSSSLLNWTRNMIALRKLFQVFGRGTLEFLNPENRKILAYLREYNGERVLCVANLSRFAQPVALDLSRWKDMKPVEMLGYVGFPPIKDNSYTLTLGPYAFLWLELQEPTHVESFVVPTQSHIAIPAESIGDVFVGPGLQLLQESILPGYLCQQRWFGSKARTIRSITVADWAPLPVPDSALAILEVCYTEGAPESYVMTLAMTSQPVERGERHFLADVNRSNSAPGSYSTLVDGFFLEEIRSAVLNIICENKTLTSLHGNMKGSAGSMLRTLPFPATSRLSSAEQSNSSVLFDDTLILKLFRRIESGINPDVEISKILTEEAGFSNTPPFAGEITYTVHETDGNPINHYVLALLQGQITNVGDGWSWTLAELKRSLDSPNDAERIQRYKAAARLLGLRTAEMHTALENAPGKDFFSEAASDAQIAADADRLQNQISATLSSMRSRFAELPEEIIEKAGLLLSKRRDLESVVDNLCTLHADSAGRWTRIHGDFHLGQVLRTDTDFVILDFEGEPAKTLDERRAPQSPLRDVAGMLRSFSYAVAAFAKENPTASWVNEWEHFVSQQYLDSYVSVRQLTETDTLRSLLSAYILEKALYELRYELNHRPEWISIPLDGVLGLLSSAESSLGPRQKTDERTR